MNIADQVGQRGRGLRPVRSFVFDRPLVLLHSDDWGRVGVRDREGFEQLRSAGLALGERPYDFYTLETAEDVTAVIECLKLHRDSSGRSACLGINLILANVDFQKSSAENLRKIHVKALADGLPGSWSRPWLYDAYVKGVADGIFYPGLHGLTHFCRSAVERYLTQQSDRGWLLRTLWEAETPYIHWRMPWVGYEYWDSEQSRDERFLDLDAQRQMIRKAAENFVRFFSMPPFSACAPGYRANDDTHQSWVDNGIHVAQNGIGCISPPYFDRHGVLQIFRTIDFEPAVDSFFSWENCLHMADDCLARGIPAVVSVHSINFHSSVKDFRTSTLHHLDQFLGALRARHPDLLFVHDADLWEIVNSGKYEHVQGTVSVGVKQRSLARSRLLAGRGA